MKAGIRFGIAATLVFAYYAHVKLNTFLSIITALYLCYEPIKKLGYLKRDSRQVERKKFGLKKARKAPQWSKR